MHDVREEGLCILPDPGLSKRDDRVNQRPCLLLSRRDQFKLCGIEIDLSPVRRVGGKFPLLETPNQPLRGFRRLLGK